MNDSTYTEDITVLDEWESGGEPFRLVNKGAGPDELQIKEEDEWRPESKCYIHGVLTHRIKIQSNRDGISVERARNAMIDAFKKDPHFRDTYVANIACVIMDNAKGFTRNKAKRDALADKILTHILS